MKNHHSLLVLLSLSYEIFSKNAFNIASQGGSLKADAKVRLFSETQNFSEEKFKNMREIYLTLDKSQYKTLHTPYYI